MEKDIIIMTPRMAGVIGKDPLGSLPVRADHLHTAPPPSVPLQQFMKYSIVCPFRAT